MIFNSYAEQKESLSGLHMISCGHIFAKPGRQICRPTGRQDWLLFYVAKESETFFLPHQVKLSQGSFLLFAPGEPQHHIYTGNKTAEFYYVHFQCRALPDCFSLKTSHPYTVACESRVCAIFEEILAETLEKAPHYELLSLSGLLQLLSLMQREGHVTEHPAGAQWKRIAYVIQHMNKHYASNLRLEDYAAMCCISKYHFLRLFRQVTGTAPMEYRMRLRMETAKELLEENELSVSRIGEEVGFPSPAYFSDAFRKYTGVSPRQYRKQYTAPPHP
ncbi:MAG: helix-turn-helix transcriptional regulator [Clostridia bacterium]|nr:helix-turn-helix transcriptional regulator [Clostridia bacterium]